MYTLLTEQILFKYKIIHNAGKEEAWKALKSFLNFSTIIYYIIERKILFILVEAV